MNALITGGTGLLGRHLRPALSNVTVVSRSPDRKVPNARVVGWQPTEEPAPAEAFEGADVVFNLAGEPIADGRWTADRKRRILESRVIGTRNLVAGMRALDAPPKVLISASAVGFYGDRGNKELSETASGGDDFLSDVCAQWEHEAKAAEAFGVRVVCIRIALILAPDGGALSKMLPPFKLGLGGRLGSGKQWMSWIHMDDLVGLMMHAANDPSIHGAVNGCAPNPVQNSAFTKALGTALKRPTIFPVPTPALRLALGQMSDVLLASQRAVPDVARRTGYAFQYPTIDGALAAVVS